MSIPVSKAFVLKGSVWLTVIPTKFQMMPKLEHNASIAKSHKLKSMGGGGGGQLLYRATHGFVFITP